MDRESLAQRLLATFLDELEEQLRTLDATLLEIEAGPPDPQRVRVVFRVMHTLKGAARAAGVRSIEEICHAIENRLVASREAGTLRPDEISLMFAASDTLAKAGRELRAGGRLESAAFAPLEQQLRGVVASPDAAPPGGRAASGPVSPAAVTPRTPATTPPSASPRQVVQGSAPNADTPGDALEQVRLGARQVDALVGAAGDVSATSSAVANRPGAAEGLYNALVGWRREWRVATRALGAHAGGRADLVAALDRLDAAIGTIVQDAGRLTRAMTDDARALAGSTARFQDHVRRLRMRPFGEVVELLPRTARDVAVQLGKEVRLVIEGQTVEADRVVLDALRDPLLQLVRNAVDHGIEPPAVRERLGKPPQGTITVGASIRGELLVVTVADDGGGIDTAAVRAALATRGSGVPLGDADLTRALLEGGVSTRATATTISGRGVGLDIVRAATERVGGTSDVSTRAGAGTTFTLTVPVSAATLRVLVVHVGDATLCIPASAAQRTLRFRRDAVRVAQGQSMYPMGDGAVPVVPLARSLGLSVSADRAHDDTLRGVLVEHGGRRAIVVVDDIADVLEVVVRPLEHIGARTAAQYAGGALLDATHVALVVSPAVLVSGHGDIASAESAPLPERRPRILVVDDSITTRTLEQSVLTAAGYDVVTAVDGVDGWRLVEAGGIDLVMTDVEMPRLDGVALCERIRASSTFASLPVIMVTSLDRPDERARGLEAGADAYVTKSSFDQDTLLEIVSQLLEVGT